MDRKIIYSPQDFVKGNIYEAVSCGSHGVRDYIGAQGKLLRVNHNAPSITLLLSKGPIHAIGQEISFILGKEHDWGFYCIKDKSWDE